MSPSCATTAHWPERAVMLLLRLYPSSFRAAFEREIVQCVRDARRALGAVPPRHALRFWARILMDLGRHALAECLAALSAWVATSATRQAAGAVLLLAAATNTAYDMASVRDSMGGLALLLTASGAALGTLLLSGRPGRHARWRGGRRSRMRDDDT